MDEEKSRKTILREALAEFLGTAMLLLVGCSASAAYMLNPRNSPDHHTDTFALTICWGLAAFIGITTSIAISGGHINPAVTIAFATLGRFPWKKVVIYITAQVAGAATGAALTFLVYYEAITAQNELLPLKNQTEFLVHGHPLSTGTIFATYPSPHVSLTGVLIDQIVGTAALLFAVMAMCDQKNLNIPQSMQPFFLGFVIVVICGAFGFNAGAPLNPARDFGPRLFTAFAGWGLQVFSAGRGHYWWIGGIVGPTLGAICGVWIYYFLIEVHHPKLESKEKQIATIHQNVPICVGCLKGSIDNRIPKKQNRHCNVNINSGYFDQTRL